MTIDDGEEQIYRRPLSGAEITTLPSARVPARDVISGRFVDLEPQDAARHTAELFEAGHGSEEALRIWDYLAYGPWPDEATYTATLRKQSASFDPIFFAVRSHATGRAAGQTSMMDIHAENGVIEIGNIWFGPDLQRTRGATEALYLMIRHAMDDLGYRRMQWRCNSLNAKSRQAARRLGFRFEGIFYNHLIFKGMNRDTAWYSILDDEWPEIRDLMEAWLGDANFDAAGVAKTSLFDAMQARGESERRVGGGYS